MHEIKTLTVVSYREFRDRHEEFKKKNKQLSITCGIQTQILTVSNHLAWKKLGKFEIDVQC